MARCNISHFPDDPEDVDRSIKEQQRKTFKEWLRNLRHEKFGSKRVKSADSDSKGDARKTLLVLEIGSGDSHHGLRAESELLLSSHPDVGFAHDASFIRINPDEGTSPLSPSSDEQLNNNAAFIKLGALEAFELLLPLVLRSENKINVFGNDL
jgi:hypothetical protein